MTGFFHSMSSRVVGVNSMCQNCVLFYGQEIFYYMDIDHMDMDIDANLSMHGGSFLFFGGGGVVEAAHVTNAV